MAAGPTRPDTVVLDLDGTLLDSVLVHVLAWQAVFREVGLQVPSHRLHRLVGIGSDRLVAEAAGATVERAMGEDLRSRHPDKVLELLPRVVPTEGAGDLLEAMRDHGLRTVLASSSDPALTDRLLDALEGSRHLLGDVVGGGEDQDSKPAGDLVTAALEHAGAERGVMVGDAVWDVLAASDAGVPCIGLLTGGTTEADLLEAGAVAVHETPAVLAAHLRETGSLLPA